MKKGKKSIALIIALVLIVTNVRFNDVRATSVSDVVTTDEADSSNSDSAVEESSGSSSEEVSEEVTEDATEDATEETSNTEAEEQPVDDSAKEDAETPADESSTDAAIDNSSAEVTDEVIEENGETKPEEEVSEEQPADASEEETVPEEVEEPETEVSEDEILLKSLNDNGNQAQSKPETIAAYINNAFSSDNEKFSVKNGEKWHISFEDKVKTIIVDDKFSIYNKNTEYYCSKNDYRIVDNNKLFINGGLEKGENKIEIKFNYSDEYGKVVNAIANITIAYYVEAYKPTISQISIKNSFNKDEHYFSTSASYLKAKVEDKEDMDNYEYSSGIKRVFAIVTTYSNQDDGSVTKSTEDKDMYLCNDGYYYLDFKVDGEYKIDGIYASDYYHGDQDPSSNIFTKNLYIKSDTDFSIRYEMEADNWKYPNSDGTNYPEWYSYTVNQDKTITLKVYYAMYGPFAPGVTLSYKEGEETVSVDGTISTVSGLPRNCIFDLMVATFEIDATTSFYREYEFKYKYFWDKESLPQPVLVKVDNEAPSGQFTVSFTAKERGYYIDLPDVQPSGYTYTYTVGKVKGSVFTEDEGFSVTVESKDPKDELSGVDHVEFFYKVDGVEQKDPICGAAIEADPKNNNNTSVSASLAPKPTEEVEQTYVISKVLLFDKAGNSVSIMHDDVNQVDYEDGVEFEVDTKSPVIQDVIYPEEIYKDPETGALYYDKKISTNVTVLDRNLLTDGLRADPVDGGLIPSITRVDEKKKKDESNKYDDKNEFVLKFTNGSYVYKLHAKDKVGHETVNETKRVVVDTEAPEISISYSGGLNGDGSGEQYSKDIVYVNVTIREPNLLRDASEIKVTGVGADHSVLDTVIPGSSFEQSGNNVFTYSFKAEVDGKYKLSVKATDKCNHVSNAETGEFYVDTHAPVVVVSYEESTPLNGYYYNQQRVANIKVTDFTFDENKVDLSMEASDAQPELSGWSGSDLEYTSKLVFSNDGKYKFRFSCTDKAGNKSDVYESDEFFIDRTSPKITVNFDNNAAENEIYYKNTRTATINIEELSFDDSTVKITPLSDGVIDALPQVSGFSGGDKNHSATIKFSEDGRYGFSVECTDLAGNDTDPVSTEVFVIDTTVPEVTIAGVEDKSANNGVVAPVVTYIDKNVDTNKSKVKTVGKNNGDITSSISLSPVTDGYVASLADFPHEKKYDDLYVVTANVYDLAGNETEKEIMFSVNRFGSVYVIDDKTAALIADYYTNVAPEVSITEINIDELQWKNVNVGRDGEMTELKSGRDYTVSETEDGYSWNSFTYTVKPKNFSKDGKYSVVISSMDVATNEQDNVVKDKEVEFAVDMTAPGIAVSGLEDEGVYEEDSHLVSFNITDNMGVVNAAIYDDGELLEEYSEDKLEKDGFTEQVELKSADKKRAIKIVSTDVAGNESVTEYNDVIISLNAKEVEAGEGDLPEVKGAINDEDGEENPIIPRNKGIPVVPIAGGSTAAVVGGYALVEFLKKKKIIGK